MTRDPEYERMIAARNAVQEHLSLFEQRLKVAARNEVQPPAAHRGVSGWRRTDEAAYQAALVELRYAHRRELGALTAKLERQQIAIRAFISSNQRSDPPEKK